MSDTSPPRSETLVRSLREPAAIIDGDLRIRERNAAAVEHPILGLEDLVSEIPEAIRMRIDAAMASGAAQMVELHKTGSCLVLPMTPDGALIIGSVDQPLVNRESFAEEQLTALIAMVVDGLICIDDHGRIELFNPACERIFGYDASEVRGKNVQMLMPQKSAVEHDQYIAAYRETGVKKIIGVDRDVEGRRKNGEIFPMKLSVGEFWHQGKRQFVGIIHDLSERTAAERRLRDLRNQVAHMGRVSAVAEMGSALAHELNQPLTAMKLYLASAERALADSPEKAVELFRRAKSEAARAGEIIRHIRQMVERTDHEMTKFNFATVLDVSIDLCRLADADRNCEILISGLPPEFEVFGDQTQIQQILVNLLNNALDATEGLEKRQIHIFARIDDDLELFIEDNGPGVATEIREQLFTPFTSSKRSGLGVGLSICRNIADAHGGALDLISNEEPLRKLGGACFRLTLPLETAANA